MKTYAITIAILLTTFTSGLANASSVKVGNKLWFQPTLTEIYYIPNICSATTGICDASTGASGTIFEGMRWANNSEVASLFDFYAPGPVNTTSPEAQGSYYFKFASGLSFFEDFIPAYTIEEFYEGSGVFAYYLTALTSSSSLNAASVMHDIYYEVFDISNYNSNVNSYWLYKPVPIPTAVILFAPALLGFMGFRRIAKLKTT